MSETVLDRSRNALLAHLAAPDWARLSVHLEPVTLPQRRVIYEPNGPISHVYFPESGMVSLLATQKDGTGVETATVGRKGMVGMPVFYGTDRFPEQAIVQLPGRALRMSATALQQSLATLPSLRAALRRYSACLYMMAGRNTLCMARHRTEHRLARWLLHSADQSGTEDLQLTHLYMAQMLSVRRSSITVALAELWRRGFIRIGRKHIVITDAEALSSFACDCYTAVRELCDRLSEDAPPEHLSLSA